MTACTRRADLPARLNPTVKSFYAMDLMYVHRYDEAIALLRDTLAAWPDDAQVLSTLRSGYHLKHMYEEALGAWKASYASRGDRDAEEALARGFEEAGYQGALQRVAELLIARSQKAYVTPWQIATLYTRAGKIDEALEWLRKACDSSDFWLLASWGCRLTLPGSPPSRAGDSLCAPRGDNSDLPL